MSMFPIATWTASGAATAFTFTNIPQTFTHLQMRAFGRVLNAQAGDQAGVQFNGDTTLANYAFLEVLGNGSSVGVGSYTSTYPFMFTEVGGTAVANTWGVSICDILDYRNTTKNKVLRAINGRDMQTQGQSRLCGGLWLSTAAITSITVFNQTGGQFADGSRFDLYGVSSSLLTGV